MRHIVTVDALGQGFVCAEDQHLLGGMRSFRLGMPMLEAIPVGCRGGGCGICRIRIRVGGEYVAKKMSKKHVSEEDHHNGIALACRIYPRSDLNIEVLSAK